jgi:hypothetical protein
MIESRLNVFLELKGNSAENRVLIKGFFRWCQEEKNL